MRFAHRRDQSALGTGKSLSASQMLEPLEQRRLLSAAVLPVATAILADPTTSSTIDASTSSDASASDGSQDLAVDSTADSLGSADSGTTDSGTTDLGTTDAGTSDSGANDSTDAQSAGDDSTTADAGSTDSGGTDSSTTDSSETDSTTSDSSADASATDSSASDPSDGSEVIAPVYVIARPPITTTLAGSQTSDTSAVALKVATAAPQQALPQAIETTSAPETNSATNSLATNALATSSLQNVAGPILFVPITDAAAAPQKVVTLQVLNLTTSVNGPSAVASNEAGDMMDFLDHVAVDPSQAAPAKTAYANADLAKTMKQGLHQLQAVMTRSAAPKIAAPTTAPVAAIPAPIPVDAVATDATTLQQFLAGPRQAIEKAEHAAASSGTSLRHALEGGVVLLVAIGAGVSARENAKRQQRWAIP